jgi:hypothetical protein
MREYLSPNHPGTGIQAFMLAKMLALRDPREVASQIKNLFEESRNILITALGPESKLVSEDLAEFRGQVMMN